MRPVSTPRAPTRTRRQTQRAASASERGASSLDEARVYATGPDANQAPNTTSRERKRAVWVALAMQRGNAPLSASVGNARLMKSLVDSANNAQACPLNTGSKLPVPPGVHAKSFTGGLSAEGIGVDETRRDDASVARPTAVDGS